MTANNKYCTEIDHAEAVFWSVEARWQQLILMGKKHLNAETNFSQDILGFLCMFQQYAISPMEPQQVGSYV